MKTSLTTSKSTVVRRVLAVVMIAALIGTAMFSAVSFAAETGNVAIAAGNALKSVYDILLKLAIPILMIYVAIAAYQFFLGGDKGPDKARKFIIYGAIGIAILYAAPLIVSTIIDALSSKETGMDPDGNWKKAMEQAK